jgi:hypothetical protein
MLRIKIKKMKLSHEYTNNNISALVAKGNNALSVNLTIAHFGEK